jgi:hypothetical protein
VPVFVIAYYIILERYDKSELMTDNFVIYFVEIVVFWHFFSRVMRSAFEMGKKHKSTVLFYIILLIALLVFKIIWYCTFAIDVNRSIYWRRLLFESIYIVMQVINGTNLGEMSQDFWFFLADCLMGMQIYTMYFMDELNYSAFNSFTPILLSVLTFLLVKGLVVNHQNKDQPCMVKTIGKHDAIFLILVYAFVSFLTYTIDFFANTYWAALGLIYVLHNIIIFPSLMESKLVVPLITSTIMVGLVTGLQVFIMMETSNPYPRVNMMAHNDPSHTEPPPHNLMGFIASAIQCQIMDS